MTTPSKPPLTPAEEIAFRKDFDARVVPSLGTGGVRHPSSAPSIVGSRPRPTLTPVDQIPAPEAVRLGRIAWEAKDWIPYSTGGPDDLTQEQMYARVGQAILDALPADDERGKVFPDDYGWDDLMTLVDHHWPADVFPVAPDSADRDAGARILSLVRLLAEQAATIERLTADAQQTDWPTAARSILALGSQRTEGQG